MKLTIEEIKHIEAIVFEIFGKIFKVDNLKVKDSSDIHGYAHVSFFIKDINNIESHIECQFHYYDALDKTKEALIKTVLDIVNN